MLGGATRRTSLLGNRRLACFITLPAGEPLEYGIHSEACGAIPANDGPAGRTNCPGWAASPMLPLWT
jgi:hypothetical protein